MDKLCRIRDLQRAVHQFEANLERLYGICLNEGMTPVSYTHLDVYKRQVLSFGRAVEEFMPKGIDINKYL